MDVSWNKGRYFTLTSDKKKYIYRENNEKLQPQFVFKDFEASNLSSCFLRWTNGLSCIQEYMENEKGGEMRRPERDVTLDIAVNVIPCLSVFPISHKGPL